MSLPALESCKPELVRIILSNKLVKNFPRQGRRLTLAYRLSREKYLWKKRWTSWAVWQVLFVGRSQARCLARCQPIAKLSRRRSVRLRHLTKLDRLTNGPRLKQKENGNCLRGRGCGKGRGRDRRSWFWLFDTEMSFLLSRCSYQLSDTWKLFLMTQVKFRRCYPSSIFCANSISYILIW